MMFGMVKKIEGFTDRLRRLVRESGVARPAIVEATGIDKSALSRFLSGERGLSLENIDRLTAFLGITVIGPHEPKANPKTR